MTGRWRRRLRTGCTHAGRGHQPSRPVRRQLEVLADAGHHLGEGRATGEVGLVGGVGEALPGLSGQPLELVFVEVLVARAPGLDRLLDQPVQAGAADRSLRGGGLALGPVQFGEVLGQPRLQGDGHAHRPSDPRIGERRVTQGRGVRPLGGGGLPPGGLGDLHPDLGQPRQHGELPLDQRPRLRGGLCD